MNYHIQQMADSFAYLAKVKDACVDLIITDPPYSSHVQGNMMSGTAFKQYVNGKLDKKSGVPKVEMPFSPLAGYGFAKDMVRVARRWAISFCAVEDLGKFELVLGRKEYVRGGIWYKPNSMGQLTGDRPAAAYEGLAIMHREGKKVWNGRGSYGIWKCNGTRGEKGRHPNQKPLNLCLMLVAKFSNRGETVLDPFCGSGRIGEACMLLGRNYIGFDQSAEWVNATKERLAATAWNVESDAVAKELCSMRGP